MSDDLTILQTAADEAKAKAEELKAALTDTSTDEDRAAADEAEKAAVAADAALAEAKAKAEEEANGSGDVQPGAATKDVSRTAYVPGGKQGDACTCPDGRKGTITVFADGVAVCLPNFDQSE